MRSNVQSVKMVQAICFFIRERGAISDGDMQTDRHGFIAVSNVRHVHGLIEELAANA